MTLTPGQFAAVSQRLRFLVTYTGYEVHIVHVQPVHKNMMNHDDEDYREAGVQASDTKKHEGKATDMVRKLSSEHVLQLE